MLAPPAGEHSISGNSCEVEPEARHDLYGVAWANHSRPQPPPISSPERVPYRPVPDNRLRIDSCRRFPRGRPPGPPGPPPGPPGRGPPPKSGRPGPRKRPIRTPTTWSAEPWSSGTTTGTPRISGSAEAAGGRSQPGTTSEHPFHFLKTVSLIFRPDFCQLIVDLLLNLLQLLRLCLRQLQGFGKHGRQHFSHTRRAKAARRAKWHCAFGRGWSRCLACSSVSNSVSF